MLLADILKAGYYYSVPLFFLPFFLNTLHANIAHDG